MDQPLSALPLGEDALVTQITGQDVLSRRLQEMGITKGVHICRKRQAPLGDPSVYFVRGSAVALRAQDAAHILVRPLHISVSRKAF